MSSLKFLCLLATLVILVVVTGLVATSPVHATDPDEYVSTVQLIASKGYPAEEHAVVTQDGYILRIHRVANPGKPVVFLQHGLLDGSHTWVMNFPRQSLGFILWDAGYDVWLGNMRGNTYARNHTQLSPHDERFWDFSWPDMAEHDLTAMIDYALKYASQKDLIYVGHSQGTLIAFSQLGINARLASQVRLFIALGPVSHVSHIKSPIRVMANLGASTTQLMWYKLFGKLDFLPSSQFVDWLADTFCNIEIVDKVFCENILFVLCGPSTHMNITRIPVYSTHSPAGTSTKDMVHFTQMVIAGEMQKYDFGSASENVAHYNQTKPPIYDLRLVKTPVALYSSTNDWLADQNDVQFIRENLPNIVDDFVVDGWNHLDFVWAVDTNELLYQRMLQLMKKF